MGHAPFDPGTLLARVETVLDNATGLLPQTLRRVSELRAFPLTLEGCASTDIFGGM